MPLLQQTHPGRVLNPNLSPESTPTPARALGNAAVAETLSPDLELPSLTPRVFEPVGSELSEYTDYLLGDELRIDAATPLVNRQEVKHTTGLDMNLLGIARRSSSRIGMANDPVRRDFQERFSRAYIFSVPRDAPQAPSRHTPAVMVANGVYLAEAADAHAAGVAIPRTSENMRIVEYGSVVTIGQGSDAFSVHVSKDGGVVVADHSDYGTEVITARKGRPVRALALGNSERQSRGSRSHPLDAPIPEEERPYATPTDPWGKTMLLPVVSGDHPSARNKS